jgi:chromosome partitioning protein
MQTIVLITLKGGVGKTTTAISLATAIAAAGRNILILDPDPQASAAEWQDHRVAEMPAVPSGQASRLAKVLQEARGIGAELIVLDTAPHSESTSPEAARLADLTLYPTNRRSRTCAECARRRICSGSSASRPTPSSIISPLAARSPTRLPRRSRRTSGYPLAPVRFSDRVVSNRCLITGHAAQEVEPAERAAQGVAQAQEWRSELLHRTAMQEPKQPGDLA